MFALAYASRATTEFREADLVELARLAAEKNRRLDICGYLNYSGGIFFQFLEGEENRVRELMQTIEGDKRHAVINRVMLGVLPNRLFRDWSMRYLSHRELRTVRLEDVLASVLLTMFEPTFGSEKVRETVLRLAERIVAARERLDAKTA
jgi:hypothetical protein